MKDEGNGFYDGTGNFNLKELIYFTVNYFIWPPLLTVLIETPIIFVALKLKNIPMIAAVNVLTNVVFSFVYVLFELKMPGYLYIYVILSEAFVIPVSEALLYNMIVKKTKKCFICSYLANICSFGIGLIISNLW